MEAEELARTLVSALPKGVPGLFNPWADVCGEDLGSNGPDAKQRRLQQHLDCDAEFILCGEAAGWQGMRHTGLAFTSERHVLDGFVPRLVDAPGRLTSRSRPFAEARPGYTPRRRSRNQWPHRDATHCGVARGWISSGGVAHSIARWSLKTFVD